MALTFSDAILRFEPKLPLAIGFSGGADSTALLLASVRRWPTNITAVHINHGMQECADAFEIHCQKICQVHGIPLIIKHVDAKPRIGQSPEDAARKARYAAFDCIIKDAQSSDAGLAFQSFALAQHADDQIETLILALTRGAGVAGLAGMPAEWMRERVMWYRPLLDVPSQDIRHWLHLNGVHWIEDPTNKDIKFTRNRIREQITPAIAKSVPTFRTAFMRSMRHCAQVQELLLDLAQSDLLEVGLPPELKKLQVLSVARKSNVIRFWLKEYHKTVPTSAQLSELIRQVNACVTKGHQIHIKIGLGYVERRLNRLNWYNKDLI
jgi:tRNA(Ile)-lysidine synthase